MFKKIWTDPVWSKVISVAIIGLATLFYAVVKSKASNISIGDVYEEFLHLKVKLVYVIGAAILFGLVTWLFRKKTKSGSYYSIKQQKIREYNNTTDTEAGILFRWGVYFDYDKPLIYDLEAYCTKHAGSPIRFIDNSCPMNNCENHRKSVNLHLVKNHIESVLIDKWVKLSQK